MRARIRYLLDELETLGVACDHVQANPTAGVVALWKPNVMTCSRQECLDLFREGAHEDCDRCHATGDITGIVYDTELRSIRILVLFALCDACKAIELHQ